ncbi:hypothetical protein [Streptomyces sp. WAC06614]|uniref:hypothetical protein n=1 Tax=Streptomyces sp. WAC06614 TaxID=2487416 RepID=UPI001C8D35EE|nr:hypothetical protein [Streptomyces sp. WAC06614]
MRELRRAVEERDFLALRIVPWLWQLPPTEPLHPPPCTACVGFGIPWTMEMIAVADKHADASIDTSACTARRMFNLWHRRAGSGGRPGRRTPPAGRPGAARSPPPARPPRAATIRQMPKQWGTLDP